MKSEKAIAIQHGHERASEFYKWDRKSETLMQGCIETLENHLSWKAAQIVDPEFCWDDQIILLLLAGKEIRHLDERQRLFTGRGLAGAVCNSPELIANELERFRPDHPLFSKGWIQPTDGDGFFVNGTTEETSEIEFELSAKAIESLGLKRRIYKKISEDYSAREPRVRLDQLVLSDEVLRNLNLALTHARHSQQLMNNWGLGEVFSYGRGVTLLFSGLPGTGKTASAEALAFALERPILIADYSRIQNCWVGQTEKNIARIFQQARLQKAVLFWDEADAMFVDRNTSSHNWEIRDTNILLQQLELFEGVCVLATNRTFSLDKALERRISLKVTFDRPNKEMREAIWKKMIPSKLPMAPDVDFAVLSQPDLSGGEIKNVVLNAARLALVRSAEGPVTHNDFAEALQLERKGKWHGGTECEIGFTKRPSYSTPVKRLPQRRIPTPQ